MREPRRKLEFVSPHPQVLEFYLLLVADPGLGSFEEQPGNSSLA